jgi:hypothetical protein
MAAVAIVMIGLLSLLLSLYLQLLRRGSAEAEV